MDIKELANKLYNMACDMDFSDYEESKESELADIENTLDYLQAYGEINPTANQHFITFLNCLKAIANTYDNN